MSPSFAKKAFAVASFILTVAVLLARLFDHPWQSDPPPVMTTQEAYHQICGEPDACASMAKFMREANAMRDSYQRPPSGP